jgi:hypothetical protein
MVTYTELFLFVSMLTAVASFVFQVCMELCKKKK